PFFCHGEDGIRDFHVTGVQTCALPILFDAEWYREQLSAPLPPGTAPVEHYVTVGSTTDISPNPCFDTEWYRQSPLTPQRLDVAQIGRASWRERGELAARVGRRRDHQTA